MVNPVKAFAICAVLWGCVPLLAWAQPERECDLETDLVAVVEALQQSHKRFTFSGTYLKESAAGREFISVTHSAGGEQGRLEYLNSLSESTVQAVWTPSGPRVSACELNSMYALYFQQGPMVAGRLTGLLELRPRDGLRLGYRLAVDAESGLVLRSEVISDDGSLLERHEYAAINVVPAEVTSAAEQQDVTLDYLDIVGLPVGYRASRARRFEQRALFMSDGIASATVVFEPLPEGLAPGEGAVRQGATISYSRGSIVAGNQVLITVIGEIPLPAARLIAEAVRAAPSGGSQ